jgi:hypothetical protein
MADAANCLAFTKLSSFRSLGEAAKTDWTESPAAIRIWRDQGTMKRFYQISHLPLPC